MQIKKNIYYSKITLHSRGFIFTDILRDKELCIRFPRFSLI
jgi:hypothetical protein